MKRFLGGVGFGYIHIGLVIIAGIWLVPFLLDHIGKDDYGLWLIGTQILAYLMLMDLGVVALLPRETAYATGRAGSLEKATDLSEIVGRTTRVVFWQMPVVAFAAAIAWAAIPAEWEPLRMPIAFVMFAFVFLFPLRIPQAVLRGLQDLPFLARVQIFSWFIATGTTIGLIFMGLGLYALALGWMTNQVTSSTILLYRLITHFPNVLPRSLPHLSWAQMKDQVCRGSWLTVGKIGRVMLSASDILILGKYLGPAAVVPFACTGKLATMLANEPARLMEAAAPALCEMKAAGVRERLFGVCCALTQGTLIASGAVVCVVLVINRAFVGWWVGIEQYGGLDLTLLLLLAMILRHWNATTVYTIFCFGYERRNSITVLTDGGVTVLVSALLISLIGQNGAPLGSILGVSLVSLPANLSVLARESGRSMLDPLILLWPWFWRFLILVIGSFVLAKVYTPDGFIALTVVSGLTFLSYCLAMLPVVLRSHLGIFLKPMLADIRVGIGARLANTS